MKNIRLNYLIGAALATVMALFTSMAFLSVSNFNALNGSRQKSNYESEMLQQLTDGISQLRYSRVMIFRAAASLRRDDSASFQRDCQYAVDALKQYEQKINIYMNRPLRTATAVALDEAMKKDLDAYVENVINKGLQAARTSDSKLMDEVSENENGYNKKAEITFLKVFNYRIALSTELDRHIEDQSHQALEITIATFVITTFIVFIIYIVFRRSVLLPLATVRHHFERIAKGDLDAPIENMGRNEIGSLFDSLSAMQEELRNIVSQVRSSGLVILASASEIARGNTNLSSRTEQQAAALEETASSIEEFASTVRQNASNADKARTITSQASTITEQGGKEMQDVVSSMKEISATANEIFSIIELIDGIAFQTNILALNASVEAARAGEHGRGFAVVAGEVRSLANRAASASGEIKELIETVSKRIHTGSDIATHAGKTIQDAVIYIKEADQFVDEIATASTQQRQGIEQINVAITEMDAVTQQNAALVEESAASSTALEKQSHNLVKLVEHFNVGHTDDSFTSPAFAATSASFKPTGVEV